MNAPALVDALATHTGRIYYARLSLAEWDALRCSLVGEWLAVTTTDRRCDPADVVLISTHRPRGADLELITPARAADLARIWLRLRLARECEASGRWARLLDLPDRRPPAAALPRCA